MLRDAFFSVLTLTKQPMTLERPGAITAKNTFLSPSNYSRNLALAADIAIAGREYIISVKDIPSEFNSILKRGDVITDPIWGRMSISEIIEMTGLKGDLLGFRIRTS